MINKAAVPTLLVLLIWFLASLLLISTALSCDQVGVPCVSPIRLIGKLAFILAPLVGGLYIFLVSKDLKFILAFCGLFYVLLFILVHFLF